MDNILRFFVIYTIKTKAICHQKRNKKNMKNIWE